MEEVHERTAIDPWFLRELHALAQDPDAPFAGRAHVQGGGHLRGRVPGADALLLLRLGAPAPAQRRRHEVRRGERASVVILGAGPNRIGQGIEFDYCCVHAAMTVRESGRDAVMINCNPETVSTDYDTSDRLYFEPLTLEDVLAVIEIERPRGRDRAVRRPDAAEARGRPARGRACRCSARASRRSTSPRTAAASARCSTRLGYKAPPYATARSVQEALRARREVGFPLLVRPSYVLGGRAMEIVYSREGLADYLRREAGARREPTAEGAGTRRSTSTASWRTRSRWTSTRSATASEVWIGGIMQHVEEAGMHSGDSACVLPPHSLGGEMLEQIRAATRELALDIGVVGLAERAVRRATTAQLYVIEANPRASRTVPFVSKAVGLPLAKLACRIMLGEPLAALGPAARARRARASATTCGSRRRCCRSTASRAPTRCSARRCARPAR